MPGKLCVVATPIGNLEDITFRAVRLLKEADWIACEDTRTTGNLLRHYSISTRTVSYHDHNEAGRSAELIARLTQGETGALVSDAGTPLVSDPGYRLVHEALAAGITVEAVPGASALLSALVVSGLPVDQFHFGGFLPAKQGARIRLLESLLPREETLVFYEAPHRIVEALRDVEQVFPNRQVAAARELTKLHEEVLRGRACEIRRTLESRASVRGEFVLLIAKELERPADELPVEEAIARLVAAGIGRMDAIKTVARERGLSKRDVYRLVNVK